MTHTERNINKYIRSLLSICVFPLILICIGFALMVLEAYKPMSDYYYCTTDVQDYGKYTGNNDDRFVLEFVPSFFPKQLQDNFSDITYSYRAENFDIYGFEVYLEFVVENERAFHQYISSIARSDAWQPFAFNHDYMEYTIVDQLELSTHGEDGEAYEHPHIMEAEIGKILYSEAEQRIIYVAIGVYDGGGVTTEYLSVFFNRFGINPIEYAQVATY